MSVLGNGVKSSRLLVAACLYLLFLCISAASQASIAVPAGLVAGDTFHVIFVSATTRDATSTDIADYDAHVQAAADAAGIGTTIGLDGWRALGSTAAVHAKDHLAPLFSPTATEPVYNINGGLVSTSFDGLWDGALDGPVNYTEYGFYRNTHVWTGTDPNGMRRPGYYLGLASIVTAGQSNQQYNGWWTVWTSKDPTIADAFYAVSEELLVTPSGTVVPVSSQNTSYRFERAWPGLRQPWYFSGPTNSAVDAAGFVYVVDQSNHVIRKFTADGNFVTQIGTEGSGDGQLDSPRDVAVDNKGFIYVTDVFNHRIVKFTDSGEYVDKWGSQGAAPEQFENQPDHIAVDSDGFVYVADQFSNRIYKFTGNKQFVTSWDGSETGGSQFNRPTGLVTDDAGFIYVTDGLNNRVRKFTVDGISQAWDNPDIDNESFNFPADITIDTDGLLYVLDEYNDQVKIFQRTGQFVDALDITDEGLNVGGDLALVDPSSISFSPSDQSLYLTNSITGIIKYRPDGGFLASWQAPGKGPGTFFYPPGVTVGPGGQVYVADCVNHRVQLFTSVGQYQTEWTTYDDGNGVQPFGCPIDITSDNSGFVYLLDQNKVFKLNASTGAYVHSWGSQASGLDTPEGLTVSSNGQVYVADTQHHRVLQYTSNGVFVRVIGQYGTGDGEFIEPGDVAVDQNGFVYVADSFNNRIQKFTSTGSFVAKWGSLGSGDGQFWGPRSIEVDSNGYLYVLEESGERIQRFTGSGTFLGSIGGGGSGFGLFGAPQGLAIDGANKLYVADSLNHRVQVFHPLTTFDDARAIILSGGGAYAGNHLWGATEAMTNYAYTALTMQGFVPGTIEYLSDDTGLDLTGNGVPDVDATATNANLQAAIATMASGADSLTIYLADHGGADGTTSEGTFRTSENETLTASELAGWLAGVSIPVTVVVDACQSGGFIQALSGPNRTIITSSDVGEVAYFTGNGALSFSSAFWNQVMNGSNLEDAQRFAEQAMSVTPSTQTPQLDANGNGTPNEDVTGGDYEAAASIVIGAGTPAVAGAPSISGGVSVLTGQPLNGTASATIQASTVLDNDGVNGVWAIVVPPNFSTPSPNNPVTNLPRFDLVETTAGNYEGTYDTFTQLGTYQVNVYAADRLGNVSAPSTTTVTVNSPLSRKAILLLVGSDSDPDWSSWEAAAESVYTALRAQGYGPDDIEFDSASTVLTSNMDNVASLTFLKHLLTQWAGSETQDLTLYLVGDSDGREVVLNASETLLASDASAPDDDLDDWLNALQLSPLPGKLTVIMDSDNAGFYLERLDLTQASGGTDFYRLASTIGGTAHFQGNGSVSYSKFFAGNIANGATVPIAHLLAKQAMAAMTNQQQVAWLDSNSDDTSDKFDISRILNYSLGPGILLAGDDPVIGSAGVDGFSPAGPLAVMLWADNITTTGTLAEVWALVTPPDTDGFGGSDPLPVNVPLTDNGTRYEASYNLPTPLGGTYTVTFYAKDTDGAVSLPLIRTLTREDDYEIDDTEAQASAIIVDDPAQYHSFHTVNDEDWVSFAATSGTTYTVTADPVGAQADVVLLVKDPGGAVITVPPVDNVPAGEHPLGAEQYIFTAAQTGIYTVKVSLDNVQTQTVNVPSDYTLAVTTDGGGSGTTNVAGQVRDTNGNPVELAFVKIDGTGGTTGTATTLSVSPNGDYSIGDSPGTYTLTALKGGFFSTNAGTVTISDQSTAIANIILTPDLTLDSDGDGVPNAYDPDSNNVDTDGDGLCDGNVTIGGVCQAGEDLNGNGVLDAGETDPSLQDTDGDGFTDLEEITAGTDPQDPASYPAMPGDVTGDNVVNVADLLVCTRIVMGLDTTTDGTPCDVAPLDTGGVPQPDGQLNAGDIAVLQQMVLQ